MRDIERMVKLLLYVTIVGGVGYWAYQNVLPAVARMIQGGGESSGGVSTAPTTGASDTAVKETGQAPAGYDFGPAKNTKPARTTLSSVAIALENSFSDVGKVAIEIDGDGHDAFAATAWPFPSPTVTSKAPHYGQIPRWVGVMPR